MSATSGFTGYWKLSHDKSSSQKELLKAMGRSKFQIYMIDSAEENFRLYHFAKGNQHVLEKDVTIFIQGNLVKIASTLFNTDLTRIHYSHKLKANGKEKMHADDEKQFGDCKSVTLWDSKSDPENFTIRWYVKNGIIKVKHSIVNDCLVVDMTFTPSDKKKKIETSQKVYDRGNLTEEDLLELTKHKFFDMLIK